LSCWKRPESGRKTEYLLVELVFSQLHLVVGLLKENSVDVLHPSTVLEDPLVCVGLQRLASGTWFTGGGLWTSNLRSEVGAD
jgi:hypothetical protein